MKHPSRPAASSPQRLAAGRLPATAAGAEAEGSRLVTSLGRMLPLRVPVAPGEPLDSWLEALARPTRPPSPPWPRPSAGSSRALQRPDRRHPGCRLAPHRAPGRAVARPPGRRGPGPPPAPRHRPPRRVTVLPGLPERPGKPWLLSWRLPWTFACTTHRAAARRLPRAAQATRARTGPAGLDPPAPARSHPRQHLLRRRPARGRCRRRAALLDDLGVGEPLGLGTSPDCCTGLDLPDPTPARSTWTPWARALSSPESSPSATPPPGSAPAPATSGSTSNTSNVQRGTGDAARRPGPRGAGSSAPALS